MSLMSPLTEEDLATQDLPENRPSLSQLLESNDAAVISAQMSSDELVCNEDIENTHQIIMAGRNEQLLAFNWWDVLRRGAINLVLPFINGVMLGFGEILAHEIGFKYGFTGARVQPPRRQRKQQLAFI